MRPITIEQQFSRIVNFFARTMKSIKVRRPSQNREIFYGPEIRKIQFHLSRGEVDIPLSDVCGLETVTEAASYATQRSYYLHPRITSSPP